MYTRQKILDAIDTFKAFNRGCSPTVKVLAKRVQLSDAAIRKNLEVLEREEYIRRGRDHEIEVLFWKYISDHI
jgi:DNA-binding MarR family transcriptional regulator